MDIPFLRIPEKKAILYYKAPDKFHLETKGLTLFPRTASRFSGPELLRMPYTALYVRRERQGPLDLHVIKVIPLSDTGQVVLATLFIGTQDAHLYRVETITRDQGKVLLDFTPGDNPYGLPRRVLITFEVPHAELPAGFTGDIDTGLESESLHIGAQQKKFRGKVAINYENYRFNTGLREDIFIKKEKK
ncbi:MAG: hypothetical protein N2110_00290 [Flavobacteriales bacterium]|nr:hypothetical protein [Flavobacteriales bacterium]